MHWNVKMDLEEMGYESVVGIQLDWWETEWTVFVTHVEKGFRKRASDLPASEGTRQLFSYEMHVFLFTVNPVCTFTVNWNWPCSCTIVFCRSLLIEETELIILLPI